MAVILICGETSAQSPDALNLQIHGYATQGLIYTTNNNWNTTDSSEDSAAWTEAVVNLSAQPQPKLHIGVQARYSLLGTLGNAVTLDWAQADYKVNEYFGFRAGKVKTPIGLLNEIQDIDPAVLWIVLPQSVYDLTNRNVLLAHFGGVVYGRVALGERMGKLDYRTFGGESVLAGDDGYFELFREQGFTVPNGLSGSMFGATLRWETPVHGLMAGATEASQVGGGEVAAGPLVGDFAFKRYYTPYLFAKYDHSRFSVSGEYNRLALTPKIQLPGIPTIVVPFDQRAFYATSTYRVTGKLSAGLYYSNWINRQAAFTSSRYQKDWALSTRYDVNSFLYLKAEQHWMDGTGLGFYGTDNSSLKPTTRMTMLKLGVSF
jgi:hypothetical protein